MNQNELIIITGDGANVAAYGPFDSEEEASQFAGAIGEVVKPVRACRIRSPQAALIALWRRERRQAADNA